MITNERLNIYTCFVSCDCFDISAERLKVIKMTSEALTKIAIDVYKAGIIARIDFEELWLKAVKDQCGYISISDIECAMDGIRSSVKGDNNE